MSTKESNMSVLTNTRGSTFEILLNRPEQHNAINWEMMQSLEAALDLAEKTSGLRGVLIHAGERGFSAGIDLLSFSDMTGVFGEGWQARMLNITAAFQGVLNRVERCSLPTIALVRGYAIGLGFELALACDIRIVAHGARLSLPETHLGLIPDVGGTTRLTRLIGPARAKEYIMTGRQFDLGDAECWGLVNQVVPADELLATGQALVEEIAQAAPLAVSYARRVIDGLADIDRGLQLEAWAQNHLIQSQDFLTGVQSWLEKKPPRWQGK